MKLLHRRILGVIAFLLLFIGFMPPAFSLYEFTGEENLPGQATGIVHWLHTAIRPQPQLAPTADIQHTDVSLYGINTFLEQEALPEVRAQSLAMIADSGFHFVRQEFVWEDIEIHAKGDFDDRRNDLDGDGVVDSVDAWAKYDNIVSLTEESGLELIVRLGNPPAWSRVMTDTIGSTAPPDNYDDYGNFVATVVERYAGRITYYQLWNEPNIYPEWGEQDANPEAFTELLCNAYQRAKAVDPSVVIIAAALSPTININGRNMNDLIFLQRMYAAGAGDCFDILAAQGYGLFSGPTDYRLRPVVINYPHNLLLRDVMVVNGDETKPIWISEMAWNVAPEPLPPMFGRVNEEEQARYAVEAYQRARRDWPWVGVANYWFFKRATDTETNEPFYYFRLVEPNFDPLPAYGALNSYLNSEEAQGREPHAAIYFGWQESRPLAAKLGIALLFLLLLQSWQPPRVNKRT